jgi:translation initiation factor 4G
MQARAVILKRILDAKVERETQALYALQALIHKLEHPHKLLHQIFECLYQADVITYEGFEQWEISKDPAEQEGKGVAIKSTTQFFTWLREVDPDDES